MLNSYILYLKKKKHFLPGLLIIILFGFSVTKSKTPPGTVKFKDSLFVDITEISNASWKEYMHWNIKVYGKDSEEYEKIIPDTSIWVGEFGDLKTSYFNDLKYLNYPVVGITYDQAVKYCEWRSHQVNVLYYILGNKVKFNPDSTYPGVPKLYKYRLPVKEEWLEIASVELKPRHKKKLSKKNMLVGNFKSNTRSTIIVPVDSYYPNMLGVKNMYGNVAEMTSVKGIALGGSWKDDIEDFNITDEIKYSQASNCLGFRCMCEKIN